MKLLLKVDVDALGQAGDTIEVKEGYARNFLIPKKMAIEATPENLRFLERENLHLEKQATRAEKQAESLAQKIETLSCTIPMKAGEADKLFGSVTSMDIEKYLKEEGLEIDRKKILLKEPIKSLGVYTVSIKLHPEVTADMKVWVVKA
jgi:large subunit ribosomal protein L9